ncbi:hypothetical protein EDD15DRAFT_2256015 [Pisolithus albus]|nr:hypothetical protein EDD15DRAFT_2256015 [Pisolithus albus]
MMSCPTPMDGVLTPDYCDPMVHDCLESSLMELVRVSPFVSHKSMGQVLAVVTIAGVIAVKTVLDPIRASKLTKNPTLLAIDKAKDSESFVKKVAQETADKSYHGQSTGRPIVDRPRKVKWPGLVPAVPEHWHSFRLILSQQDLIEAGLGGERSASS